MVDFTWNTQACDGAGLPTGTAGTGLDTTEQAFFTAAGVDELQDLTQFGTMTDGTSATVDQKTAARGANLVNFLRGQRGKEGYVPNDIDKLYRARKAVLGDIVNSQPLYVRKAAFSYNDTGYSAFATSVASRTPMAYVAANDGMLHAFYATTDALGGEEAWSFIPRAVLPRLYKLADTNYAQLHEYYVDGRPIRDDVFDTVSGTWKTILVGGLNKGGRGYYALDVTDPTAPKALWEFTHDPSVCVGAVAAGETSDCHLGYTFGNPVITKLTDGRWVVFVASGYNNVNTPVQAGDGQGYLYVLEAMTGKVLYKIRAGDGTPAFGTATSPSGLAKITAWVNDSAHNNTTLRVYGGDLLGNVWRFDVNDQRGRARAPGAAAGRPRGDADRDAEGRGVEPAADHGRAPPGRGRQPAGAVHLRRHRQVPGHERHEHHPDAEHLRDQGSAHHHGVHGPSRRHAEAAHHDHERHRPLRELRHRQRVGQLQLDQRLVRRPARAGRAGERLDGAPARHARGRLERPGEHGLRTGRLRLPELLRLPDRVLPGRVDVAVGLPGHGTHGRLEHRAAARRLGRRVPAEAHRRASGQGSGPDQRGLAERQAPDLEGAHAVTRGT